MTILQIYQKYNIPPNLQEHMIRVTKAVTFILNHWKGPEINRDLLIKAALYHDLGNIVKFDLKSHPEFLGSEQTRVEYWKSIQQQMIKKYGDDDHEATEKMLEEIGVDEKTKTIIAKKSFGNSMETEKSSSWETKILFYADLRSGPFGVIPLQERLADVVSRLEKYKNREDLDQLIEACKKIESQIQENLNFKVDEITEDMIKDIQIDITLMI